MRAKFLSLLRLGAILMALGATVWAAGLNVGDRAPDFVLLDPDSRTVKLQDVIGRQKTILVFYRTSH